MRKYVHLRQSAFNCVKCTLHKDICIIINIQLSFKTFIKHAYRQVCGQRGRNVTVALAVSPVNGLVFHSAYIGGMNAPHFNDFLAQTRQNLDPDEEVIFIYDGAPAHRNPAIPAANTELEMLPAYTTAYS